MALRALALALLLASAADASIRFQEEAVSSNGVFKVVEKTIEAMSTSNSAPRTIYMGIHTAKMIGVPVADKAKSEICARSLSFLENKGSSLKDFYYFSKLLASLQCTIADPKQLAQNVHAIAGSGLGKGKKLPEYHYVMGALVELKPLGLVPDVGNEVLESIQGIMALKKSDGEWAISAKGSKQSAGLAGLAYQALSDAIMLDKRCAEKISAAKASADLKALFDGAQKHASGAIEFKGEDADGSSAGLIATSRVLKGLLALSEQVAGVNDAGKELSQKYFPAIAKLFRRAMPVASTSEAFYLLEGLEALSTNNLGKVMEIFVDDLVVDAKSGGAVKGQVRLANGSPLPDDCPVSLQVGPPLSLQSQASEAFVVSLDSSSLSSPGLLTSVISVTTSAESLCIPFQDEVAVRVMDHLELKSVKLAVDNADVALKYPSTYETPLKPVEAVTIEVVVSTSLSASYIPEQAFLLWKTEKVSLYQPLTASGDSTALTAQFSLNDTSPRFDGDLFLVIGDSFCIEGVFWKIAPVVSTQSTKKAPKGAKPGVVPMAYAASSFHRLLPEITHVFRVPEKRPSSAVSLLFTALSILPCLVFLGVLITFFPLQSSMFPRGKDGIAAMVFHSTLGGGVFLYALYWLGLNIFQIALPGIVLFCAGLVSAHYALSSVTSLRIRKTKQL